MSMLNPIVQLGEASSGATVLNPYSQMLTPQQWGALGTEILTLSGTPTLDADGLHLGPGDSVELVIPDTYRAGCTGLVFGVKTGTISPDTTNDYLIAWLKDTTGAADLTGFAGIGLLPNAAGRITAISGTPGAPSYSLATSAIGGTITDTQEGLCVVSVVPNDTNARLDITAAIPGGAATTSGTTITSGTTYRTGSSAPTPRVAFGYFSGTADSEWLVTRLHLQRTLAIWAA